MNESNPAPSVQKLAVLETMRQTPHVCFAEAMRSANRAVTRHYARYIKPTGMTGSQLSILIRLYYTGPVPMSDLAEAMETDRTTMVRNIALLEKGGYVAVQPILSGRVRDIMLTGKGMDMLTKALPSWQQAQDDLKTDIGAETWSVMMAGLRRLAEID